MIKSKQRNFKENIKHFFIVNALIPLAILLAIFCTCLILLPQLMVQMRISSNNKILNQRMVQLLESYTEIISDLSQSNEMIAYLDHGVGAENIFKLYYQMNQKADVQSTLHLFDQDGNNLLNSLDLTQKSRDFVRLTIIPRLSQTSGILFETNNLEYISYANYSYMAATKIQSENHFTGYLILQFMDDSLDNYFLVNGNEIIILTDQYNNLIYSNISHKEKLKFKFLPEPMGTNKCQLSGKEYYYVHSAIPNYGINIYSLNATESNTSLYIGLIAISVVIAAFMFWLLQMLANRMSRQNSRSMDHLLAVVEQLSPGKTELTLETDSQDEFQVLADQYQQLVNRISVLLKNNAKLSELKGSAEMRLLEAQFNPHFILNVLESLRYSLHMDLNVSHQIIDSLSAQLKYSLYATNRKTTLEDELLYIDEYIKLHQIRFDSQITFITNVANAARQSYIPKLILQPLIENSIKYGFRYQDTLQIEIISTIQDQTLFLTVRDNGQGLSPKEYGRLQQLIASESFPDRHIGLYNLNRRLVLLYGTDYHIWIQNQEGSHFSVTLRLPFEEG